MHNRTPSTLLQLPIIGDKVQVSLATNAATQSTLSEINLKTPALGQALAAASQPVVLTTAQVDLLKPFTGGLTDTQLRAVAVPISGSVDVGNLTP